MSSLTKLPEAITKEILFKKAQERFSSWANMYANPDVTIGQMYDDMTCSVFSGEPEHDFVTEDTRTPKEKMQEKFCDIFDEANLGFTAWDLNERHGDEPVPGYFDAWDNFMNQIGEAMGPICYAGYILKRKFTEANQYAGWVDKCINYYEKNWEF